jgi:protein-tyrosine phosphatase
VGRNRYANVDPYQSNRVKLRVPEGHNDYINASPVELTSTKSGAVLKYIATQVRWEEHMNTSSI